MSLWGWWSNKAAAAPGGANKSAGERSSRPQASRERRTGRSPYSDQYETIVGRGHTRPTAAFGAPTLIWHIGVWPRRMLNEETGGDPCDPHDTADQEHDEARRLFGLRRRAWIEEIDRNLRGLEEGWVIGRRTGKGSDDVVQKTRDPRSFEICKELPDPASCVARPDLRLVGPLELDDKAGSAVGIPSVL